MRLRSIAIVLLGLLLTGASSVWAQVSTTGTIQVIVEDPQGGRLPGVSVSAYAPDVLTNRETTSDAEGVATLEALTPSARYIVHASLAGFRDQRRVDILVRSGQMTTLHAELSGGAYYAAESAGSDSQLGPSGRPRYQRPMAATRLEKRIFR